MIEAKKSFEEWFNSADRYDSATIDGQPQAYSDFVRKFEPKKTTDDCYTPPLVYDAVAEWVCKEYGVSRDRFVRPFYPGGDYLHEVYNDGCVVVDNPPFSILSEVEVFYLREKIPFFLFAPGLTLFKPYDGLSFLCCYTPITYANGAVVQTSFVTNMEPRDVLARSVPDLSSAVSKADEETQKANRKTIPKYDYPDSVLAAFMLNYMSNHGIPFTVHRQDAKFIRALDSQKAAGKAIFGGGYLLSDSAAAEKAAAEKAAAEKAAAIKWTISEREQKIIESLGRWRGS